MSATLKCTLSVLFAALLLASCASAEQSIGDGLWRTFSDALLGDAPALPLSITAALEDGWYAMDGGKCDPMKGVRYVQDSGRLPIESAPLTVFFTASGYTTGAAVDVFGEDAAPQKLVDQGFWEPVVNTTQQWTLSVSFRNSSSLCDLNYLPTDTLGTQLVINQGALSFEIPVTAEKAKCADWFPGSCMRTMGQHWFYDIESSPEPSWKAENLVPIVAMYYPPDETGVLSTFFFTTPTEQEGGKPGVEPGDWEPAISSSLMCANFCEDACTWNVDTWNTMHIYTQSHWTYISCPGGRGPIARTCPDPFSPTC